MLCWAAKSCYGEMFWGRRRSAWFPLISMSLPRVWHLYNFPRIHCLGSFLLQDMFYKSLKYLFFEEQKKTFTMNILGPAVITGDPHKRRVWLFVRNVKKCMGEYWRVLYRKLLSRNGRVKAQNKCKIHSNNKFKLSIIKTSTESR